MLTIKRKEDALCLNEKYEIACYKGDNILNKSNKILGTCRHKNKYKLKIATQRTVIINQPHNVIKDTITLT